MIDFDDGDIAAKSINELIDRLSETDMKMLVKRVRELEDNSVVDILSRDAGLKFIFGYLSRQELAIKYLIWGNKDQALAALRGEFKEDTNGSATDPI